MIHFEEWDIQFDNPEGLEGHFVTVRNGTKWFDLVKCGHTLCLNESGGIDDVGQAVVLHAWKYELCQIPASLLNYEHDPRCRTYSGLVKTLEEAYNTSFYGDEEVTVLMLWRESK